MVRLDKGKIQRDKKDHITGISGVLRDITEKKQAKEKLKESEEYFKALIDNSSDVIAILDINGILTYTSPSYKKVLGYIDAPIGENMFEYVHPDDRNRIIQQFKNKC